jgi:hypothetical protein
MESRSLSTESFTLPAGAILGVSPVICEPQFIKIASLVGDGTFPTKYCREHFRGRPFSFERTKENEQSPSHIISTVASYRSSFQKRSFSCLGTRERTQEKVKAGKRMANHFSAELEQMLPYGIPQYPIWTLMSGIKHILFLQSRRDEYLFFNAPFGKFFPLRHYSITNDAGSRKAGLNAIFSHAILRLFRYAICSQFSKIYPEVSFGTTQFNV